MSKTRSDEKVRYAVVGLGHISQVAVLPAFEHTQNSELCALVSGDEAKCHRLAQQYGVGVSGSYEELERVLHESHANAVYLATPNSQHRSQTERAARAGVHVLCEKPMAETVQDCQAMIDCCTAAGVLLMIAYRLHFDEASLDSVSIVRSGQLGVPRLFTSMLTQQAKSGDIRTRRELAGGALYDLGVYPINAARHLFGAEPIGAIAVSNRGDRRFDGVDATTSATLIFEDDQLAQFSVSLAASPVSSYRLIGEKGDLLLEPAYAYKESLKHVLTIGDNSVERRFIHKDQFAAQISSFSRAVLGSGEVGPSGDEGLADVRVVEALIESQRSGRQVDLPRWPHTGRLGCG
jgi:predicted dehydrogenase